ncbi:hypothetical protein Salat_0726600 [Sesamum alatum]|uniref:Uncharacterized protein n=1 Tax=Sesamum alatum TaxID=300844 RepID=A0AAE1YTA6_9LAMI|nr:hypothetical protein Salat_0726600 [Sesamum alatum]
MPWEWDPFDLASDLTWIKFWLLAIFFFIFSFVSIGIPLTPPSNLRYIQVEMKSFSASLLALPDVNILITAINPIEANGELHEGEEELERANLEEGRAQKLHILGLSDTISSTRFEHIDHHNHPVEANGELHEGEEELERASLEAGRA